MNKTKKVIIDDLDALIDILPPLVSVPLRQMENRNELIEVILDLGRPPEARLFKSEIILDPREVTQQDIDYVVSHIGTFSDDNRAGIARTLHRISAIRNRRGSIVGLTCRVGRAVFGTMKLIEDLVESGRNILLLGRPGVGKTTMLREVARVLADEIKKRVIIVDTSNEIAGDGDIPHPAIGHARRMQVPTPNMQHAVMIEAVENHMPEAIIVDEIGTELEAMAARTIAERGVQLVGTAHGISLENLILNPTLSDLIGGIQTVTLGDEEARRRGTQKSILERKAPPTFDVVVEIQDFNRVAVHPDVGQAVDAVLRGRPIARKLRSLDDKGKVQRDQDMISSLSSEEAVVTRKYKESQPKTDKLLNFYLFGINRAKLEQAARDMGIDVHIVRDIKDANLFLTSKHYYRRKTQPIIDAESSGLTIYVIKSNSIEEIKQFLVSVYADDKRDATISLSLKEAEDAITQVMNGRDSVRLSPQNAYIRRLQHLMAERSHLSSRSRGKEPQRMVEIYKDQGY